MSDLLTPQPAPVDTGHRPRWPLVIVDVEETRQLDATTVSLLVADMRARDEQGRAKYAYQEALDGCVYLRAHIEEGFNGYLVADRAWDAYWAAVRHAHDLRGIIALRDSEKAK